MPPGPASPIPLGGGGAILPGGVLPAVALAAAVASATAAAAAAGGAGPPPSAQVRCRPTALPRAEFFFVSVVSLFFVTTRFHGIRCLW